jgi:hypothetical protein
MMGLHSLIESGESNIFGESRGLGLYGLSAPNIPPWFLLFIRLSMVFPNEIFPFLRGASFDSTTGEGVGGLTLLFLSKI